MAREAEDARRLEDWRGGAPSSRWGHSKAVGNFIAAAAEVRAGWSCCRVLCARKVYRSGEEGGKQPPAPNSVLPQFFVSSISTLPPVLSVPQSYAAPVLCGPQLYSVFML